MVHNAFHHEHSHGRAFHGIEARNMLHAEKRDSHGDTIKLNEPEDNKARFIHNLPHGAQKAAGGNTPNVVETVYSQVYVTEPAGSEPTQSAANGNGKGAADTTTTGLSPAQQSYLNAKSQAQAPNAKQPSASTSADSRPSNIKGYPLRHHGETTTTPASSAAPTHAVGTPLQNGQSTSAAPSVQANQVKGTPLTHASDPTAVVGTPLSDGSNNVIGQKSEGMSGGAKAGLAFGILILIALVGGLVFFCWRRRKAQQGRSAERLDEKRATQDSFFGGTTAAAARGPQRESVQSEKSVSSARTAQTAPRLSLRPVTQFLPNILGGGDKAAPTGNTLDVPAMSEKPKSNPFADPSAAPANPFEDGAVVAGNTSLNHSKKESWEGSEPATPKSTSFGTAAAVPITGANAAAGARPSNNVHRVQLDFKPSMEDELELRSGQLVRMLHSYDDGWALCIRLDRSQQGVCPRTCLSKLPVKPRPQGPPPPNGAPGRPMGPPPPGMRRPASPQINNGNMVPRPLTPTGRERANTLGRNSPAPGSPSSRPRSQSMSGMGERPMTPNSMPARKPVPGMAL